MSEAIKSLSEHAGIIVLILGGFSIWSLKRILGKIENNIEELFESDEKADKKCEERAVGVYGHIDSIRRERDAQISGINTRLSTLEGEHRARHSGGNK